MPTSWLALIATVLCSGGGNAIANWSHRFAGIRHLYVLAIACGVQGVGLVFYTVAITSIPLSIAYPVLVGSTMVLVTLFAAVWFKEKLTPRHLFGLVLIIIGIVLINSGQTTRGSLVAAEPPPVASADEPAP